MCHILNSFCRQRQRDVRSPIVVLRLRHCRVQVSCNQQCGALGHLLERGDGTLYRRVVVGGEVASNDVPLPRPRRQLEAEDVDTKLSHGLHPKNCDGR